MHHRTMSAALILGVVAAGVAGPLQAATNNPVSPTILAAIVTATGNPAAPPPGANIVPCHSAIDAYPVVLVNGTFTVMEDSFGAMAPDFANAGYCVYTFNYGGLHSNDLVQAIGPVAASAQQLASFVSQVQSVTGSPQVDLVGYSQGGLLVEYYAKVLHGAANIHTIVAVAPTTHGTTLDGLALLATAFGANGIVRTLCAACADQENGSAIVQALDAGPIAQAGVKYTVIETRNETVVTPVGSSFIQEAGVTNEYVQGFCPFDPVDHVDMTFDNVVLQLVKNALTPGRSRSPNCFVAFPVWAR